MFSKFDKVAVLTNHNLLCYVSMAAGFRLDHLDNTMDVCRRLKHYHLFIVSGSTHVLLGELLYQCQVTITFTFNSTILHIII